MISRLWSRRASISSRPSRGTSSAASSRLCAGERPASFRGAHAHAAPEVSTKFAVALEFNDPLAHLIEAGSDFFLMPSRYEPCGLNQMYSLRYGTVPIVRATGGLADTVEEYSLETGKGNGFVFEEYTGEALLGAIRRGLALYQKKRPWKKLITEIMAIDHSWGGAARKYEQAYERGSGEADGIRGLSTRQADPPVIMVSA